MILYFLEKSRKNEKAVDSSTCKNLRRTQIIPHRRTVAVGAN